MNDAVPFLDLQRQYQSIKTEVAAAIQGVLDTSCYLGGPEVSAFEGEFARFVGAGDCVAMSNGTAALHYGFRALGIGPGDEVIIQANTFIATAGAVALAGATPVFVDIQPDDFGPSAAQLMAAVTPRTKAIAPVHLFGQPAPDLLALVDAARARGLFVVEDCAQGHGAQVGGRNVGTFGDLAAFSFYPGKNLGAYGDGGAVVTSNPQIAHRLRAMRSHGAVQKFQHELVGSTERLDAIQAAILRIKLRRLSEWNEKRRKVAHRYDAAFGDLDELWFTAERRGTLGVYHLYVLRHPRCLELLHHLKSNGIGVGRHYPVAVHLTPAFEAYGQGAGSLPVAEEACRNGLSLPIFPEIRDTEVARVIQVVREFFGKPAT